MVKTIVVAPKVGGVTVSFKPEVVEEEPEIVGDLEFYDAKDDL